MFGQKVPHLNKQSRTKASKQFVLLFLALLQICGFITLAVSIWIAVQFQVKDCSFFKKDDGNLLLASSVLCILLCWSGFCIVLKERKDRIELYPLLLVFFVIIILQIMAGISATVNSAREDEFQSSIAESFRSNDSKHMECSRNTQIKFDCCGYHNYSDWLGHTEDLVMLLSCDCSHGDDDCLSIQINGAIYSLHKYSCKTVISNEVLKKHVVIRVFSAVIPVVELVLIIFTSCMLSRLSQKSVVEVDSTAHMKGNPIVSLSAVQLQTFI